MNKLKIPKHKTLDYFVEEWGNLLSVNVTFAKESNMLLSKSHCY
jgi:hypothetical protein